MHIPNTEDRERTLKLIEFLKQRFKNINVFHVFGDYPKGPYLSEHRFMEPPGAGVRVLIICRHDDFFDVCDAMSVPTGIQSALGVAYHIWSWESFPTFDYYHTFTEAVLDRLWQQHKPLAEVFTDYNGSDFVERMSITSIFDPTCEDLGMSTCVPKRESFIVHVVQIPAKLPSRKRVRDGWRLMEDAECLVRLLRKASGPILLCNGTSRFDPFTQARMYKVALLQEDWTKLSVVQNYRGHCPAVER